MPSKTTVANLLTKIKRQADYDITSDTPLDNMLVDFINDGLKRMFQMFYDYSVMQEISSSASFKTVESQDYVDIENARIVGDVASFTAVAGDKITVTIDGTAYTTAALTGAVLVATVVTAINLATAAIGDVASKSTGGFLVITSLSSGSSSAVIIADNAGTPASRLFTVEAERTQSAIADLDEITKLSERNFDAPIQIIPYTRYIDLYTDPTVFTSTAPDHAARWNNRIYFGPRPTGNIYIYLDYMKQFTEVTSSSTLPFSYKYDPVITAIVVAMFVEWLERSTVAITVAHGRAKTLTDELIVSAAKNVGRVSQARSRSEQDEYIQPRRPLD